MLLVTYVEEKDTLNVMHIRNGPSPKAGRTPTSQILVDATSTHLCVKANKFCCGSPKFRISRYHLTPSEYLQFFSGDANTNESLLTKALFPFQWFGVRCVKYSLSPFVGTQRIVAARGFGGGLTFPVKCRNMLGHQRPTNRRTTTSVKCLWTVVDCVCVVGMVRQIGFQTTTNPRI
ncbi:hypothetical protein AVEN_148093-1 [Araneus ventricosus]|uniref:Uncharacterized protein n=1 Tax=Araneus ventricosus TaxID=182803 RepID=A0A4Y2G8T3_ARAVE|nr:hypothetical protein AVEN_148093-1 [Araneus ventricosus]